MNYNQYLKSNNWKNIKRLFKNSQCFFCHSDKNLHLHHRNYENIGSEKKDDLITLCNLCHKAIHFADFFNGNGKIKRWQSGSELYIKARSQGWMIKGWKKRQKLNNFRARRSLLERQAVIQQYIT